MNNSTETLLEHYKLHGYPQDKTKALAEADVRQDIHVFVQNRIKQLTNVDPFYLDDPKKTELRIVGSMANQLGIKSKTLLADVPGTKEELQFLKDFEQKTPPKKIEEFEQYLEQYQLPKKEGLSAEVRTKVARIIMIRYIQDAKNLHRVLISPVMQNFLTNVEYGYIIKNAGPVIREQLLYRYTMQESFEKMDDDCRRLLLEGVEPKKELKEVLRRIVGTDKNLPSNLSRDTRAMLIRLVTLLQDEKLLFTFFSEYPSADTLNAMFQVTKEETQKFILDFGCHFLDRLSPEEKEKINWKVVFDKLTGPSVYFSELLHHFPEDLHNPAGWEALIDAAIAQKDDRIIQKVLNFVPKYDLPKVAYTKLFRAANIE